MACERFAGGGARSTTGLIREKDNDPERVAAELRIGVEGLTLPSGTPSGCIGLVGRKPVVPLALYHRLIAGKPLACS